MYPSPGHPRPWGTLWDRKEKWLTQWGRHRTEHSTISSQLQTQLKAALRAVIWVTVAVLQVCEMGLGSAGHRASPPGYSPGWE